MADSLIYIPDISGFTNFVNNTELNHAQHIISELLELIIDGNELGMEVAEIEGDAVLFYKHNEVPPVEDIVRQSEKIFLAFHKHLVRYESERLCQCGACSTASNLTLKIIAHTGEIGFTKVKDRSKPFGPILVEAHRLLKNDLDDKEYLLLTDHYKSSLANAAYTHITTSSPWIALHSGKRVLDNATIEFTYIPFTPLHSRIEPPSPPPAPAKISDPVSVQAIIERPLYFVFEMVSNLDFRLFWNKDIKELIYEQGKTNRVGTKHRCLFDNGFADFETITNDFGKDAVVYGEKLSSIPIARDVSIYYILKENGDFTDVKIEFHFHPKPIWGWLIVPLIRKKAWNNINKAITALKNACEAQEHLEYQIV